MHTLVVSIAILSAFLLVLVILAQNPKGGGLSSQFGGSGASNLIGIKKTSDLLEKLTWGCVFAIMLLSLATHFTASPGLPQQQDRIIDRVNEQPDLPQQGLDLQVPPALEDQEADSAQ